MIRNLAADATGLTSNVFLVDGDRRVLVDAGSGFDVVGAVREHVADLDALVVTHTHQDHVDNLEDVTDAFGVEVWGYDTDQPGIDHALVDGDTVTLGDHDHEVIYTPGHKNDHVCLYAAATGVLFAGDLVFANGGFGRTDLAEGDRDLLVESIERVLDRVDAVEQLHCGHGPSVTADARDDLSLALRSARMRA